MQNFLSDIIEFQVLSIRMYFKKYDCLLPTISISQDIENLVNLFYLFLIFVLIDLSSIQFRTLPKDLLIKNSI